MTGVRVSLDDITYTINGKIIHTGTNEVCGTSELLTENFDSNYNHCLFCLISRLDEFREDRKDTSTRHEFLAKHKVFCQIGKKCDERGSKNVR